MGIKLNIRKAYARLDWDFIRKCFFDLGFSDIWINWMIQCITTPYFRILLMIEQGIHFVQSRA